MVECVTSGVESSGFRSLHCQKEKEKKKVSLIFFFFLSFTMLEDL